MAETGYINQEVAKMYGIPYSRLTPEQKRILHADSVRRAKLIKEREQDVLKNNRKAFEDEAKMEKVLGQIYRECQKEILADVAETIAKVQKAGGDWSYANQSALTRSRGLFEQIDEQIKKLGQKESLVFTQGLTGIYTDQFLRELYGLGQVQAVKANFNVLNPTMIRKTLDYPWSGAMFSDRLWNDKATLGRNLRVGLTQSMILGEGIPQITERINKNINTSQYNAERVARTETKRVSYCAQSEVWEQNGVKELRYRCANGGDSRTCSYCSNDNNKVFKKGEEPTLPRHPNCRCTYIPVTKDTFEDNELNELTGSIRGAENYEKWRQAEAKKQAEAGKSQNIPAKDDKVKVPTNSEAKDSIIKAEEMKLTDYPEEFYSKKEEAKNTQALMDYVNNAQGADPTVVAMYRNMDKLWGTVGEDVELKITHKESRVRRSWTKDFMYRVDVGIPKIDPKYVGTYDTNLHEQMHFLDALLTTKDNKDKLPNGMFSQSYKPLIDAFSKATPKIGARAKKLFEDFAKEHDILIAEAKAKYDKLNSEYKDQYYAGKIDYKKYTSLAKKALSDAYGEADYKARSLFGGGVAGLQDIYDAISKGKFRDDKTVIYGHGSSYYTDRRRINPNCSESLANYASLAVGHPEMLEILAEDHPEIVSALKECVETMLKEVM